MHSPAGQQGHGAGPQGGEVDHGVAVRGDLSAAAPPCSGPQPVTRLTSRRIFTRIARGKSTKPCADSTNPSEVTSRRA